MERETKDNFLYLRKKYRAIDPVKLLTTWHDTNKISNTHVRAGCRGEILKSWHFVLEYLVLGFTTLKYDFCCN